MFNQEQNKQPFITLALFAKQLKAQEAQFHEMLNQLNVGDRVAYFDPRCCVNWHTGIFTSRTQSGILIQREDSQLIHFAYFEPISYQLLQQEKTPIDVLESRLAALSMDMFRKIREQGFSEQLEKDFYGFMRKEFDNAKANS
ncbi:hypothetical protein [Providencia manganoxydans]|uniref:hypothetical protein n=1 Tax=Providencia manganoxydans TaxID=2923283 RepID=UPI0032DBB795